MRDSFVFYKSFLSAIDELTPDIQLEVYQAICHYAIDGIEPDIKGISFAIFSLIKPQIDANNKKYENGKKGAEFGKLGGRPKQEKPQKNPNKTPNVNDNVNDNENVNDNVNVNVNVEEEKLKNIDNFFGEFKNVFLSKENYDTLKTCILNDVILNELIEELSSTIASNNSRYKPYDEKYPNAHYLHLKAFWKYRKEHPEKFTHKECDSGGDTSNLASIIDKVYANIEKKKKGYKYGIKGICQ